MDFLYKIADKFKAVKQVREKLAGYKTHILAAAVWVPIACTFIAEVIDKGVGIIPALMDKPEWNLMLIAMMGNTVKAGLNRDKTPDVEKK